MKNRIEEVLEKDERDPAQIVFWGSDSGAWGHGSIVDGVRTALTQITDTEELSDEARAFAGSSRDIMIGFEKSYAEKKAESDRWGQLRIDADVKDLVGTTIQVLNQFVEPGFCFFLDETVGPADTIMDRQLLLGRVEEREQRRVGHGDIPSTLPLWILAIDQEGGVVANTITPTAVLALPIADEGFAVMLVGDTDQCGQMMASGIHRMSLTDQRLVLGRVLSRMSVIDRARTIQMFAEALQEEREADGS